MIKLLRMDELGRIEDNVKVYSEEGRHVYDDSLGSIGFLHEVHVGSLVNLVTNFLRVGVKPEACKKSVDEVLDEDAELKALKISYNIGADCAVLSKDSVREIKSTDVGDTIYATYVATFYAFPKR